jgi:RNA polymerase sigma-70 factor (ECF subfamily)
MAATIDELLDRIGRGDEEATGELLRTYEPYLRAVVRRQLPDYLRRRFDSVDVVQSVWANVLETFRRGDRQFADAGRLRAFLVTAARNRLIDRYRQHHRSADRECSLDASGPEPIPAASQPRPSEIASADETWRQLLAICPAEHHEVLHMKRDGFSVTEIAARTGLHPDSIHRILRQLARELALRGARVPSTV